MRLADAKFSAIDGAIIAAVSGEIDASNAGDLGAALTSAVTNDAVGIVLDLGRVRYLDSAGIHLLFRLSGDVGARGQGLALVVPQASAIKEALRLAGAEQSFSIAETVGQGLRSLAH